MLRELMFPRSVSNILKVYIAPLASPAGKGGEGVKLTDKEHDVSRPKMLEQSFADSSHKRL